MNKKSFLPLVVLSVTVVCLTNLTSVISSARAEVTPWGIGIQSGFSKLEGDWKGPQLSPMGNFLLSYSPNSFLSLVGQVGYSALKSDQDAKRINPSYLDQDKLKVMTAPIEFGFKFNFAPRTKVNPYATLGIGALRWDVKYDGETLMRNGKKQREFTPILKTEGGLELFLSPHLGLTLGAGYRHTFSDVIDQISSGDEKDGMITVSAGLMYYFKSANPNDRDRDQIPDELDLEPWAAEDTNGFMDHDGRPEGGLPANFEERSPVVLHYPVHQHQARKDLHLEARILTSVPLRTAAVLYRPIDVKNWRVVELKLVQGNIYLATLSKDMAPRKEFEYCIVAVDQDLKGIGYSGLPNRPIRVKVIQDNPAWRVAGGLVAALGWGAASYLVFRNQNN